MKTLLVLLLLQFIYGRIATDVPESARSKFTQLKCEIFDKSYGDFSLCKIFYVQRQVDAVSFTFKIARNISSGVTIHYQVLKKESGWHPFLYEGDLDVCDFLKNRKKNFLVNLVYTQFENYTNIKHNCPFSRGEELKLISFQLNGAWILKRFPISIGEYALLTNWYINKKLVGRVFGSVAYTDYRTG